MVKPDIHTLAHHLKQERLYVASEKQLIQRLNSDVLKTAERLYRAAWIAKQQRINLDRLILTRSDKRNINNTVRHGQTKSNWCSLKMFLIISEHFTVAFKTPSLFTRVKKKNTSLVLVIN